MRKFLIFILVVSLVLFSFAACGSKEEEADSSADEPVILKVGSTVQDDSACGLALNEYFKPYIEEKSNGKIIVEVYNNGVLGGDRQLFEALQINTVQASAGPLSVLANFDDKFGAADLPYLFNNKEDAYAALDGEFGDLMKKDLPKEGMRALAYFENAFRNLSNSQKPIESLDDLNGLKIRVMESPVHIATFKALGANPTPMAFNELYTALQQGTVDGQDNGIVLTYTTKLYEAQKYYTISQQCYAACSVVVSEKFWQNLTPELQKVVEDGSYYFAENQRRLNTEMEEEYLNKMKEAGLEVNELSESAVEEFKAATQPVWDEMAPAIGEEMMEAVRALNKQ